MSEENNLFERIEVLRRGWLDSSPPNDEAAGFHYEVVAELIAKCDISPENSLAMNVSNAKRMLSGVHLPRLTNETADHTWLTLYWKTAELREALQEFVDSCVPSKDSLHKQILEPSAVVAISQYAYEVGVIREKIAAVESELEQLKAGGNKAPLDDVRIGALGVSIPISTVRKLNKELVVLVNRGDEDKFRVGRVVHFLKEFYRSVSQIASELRSSGVRGYEAFLRMAELSGKALQESLRIIAKENNPNPVPVSVSRDMQNGRPRLSDEETRELRLGLSTKYGTILSDLNRGILSTSVFSEVQRDLRKILFAICVQDHDSIFVVAEPLTQSTDARIPIDFKNEGISEVLTMTLFEFVDSFILFSNQVLNLILEEGDGTVDIAKYRGVISLKAARANLK